MKSNKDKGLESLKQEILNLEKQIRDLTQKLMQDSLTSTFNRRHLEEVELSKWHGKKCFVSFVDSNKLKQINDKYGHFAGDKHLIEIANQLKQYGTVIRYGGDEFVVLSKQNFDELKSNTNFTVGKFVKEKSMPLSHAILMADKDMYKNKTTTRQNYM